MVHTQVSGREYGPNRKLSIEGEDWPGRNTGGAGWSGEQGEGLGFHQFVHPKIRRLWFLTDLELDKYHKYSLITEFSRRYAHKLWFTVVVRQKGIGSFY